MQKHKIYAFYARFDKRVSCICQVLNSIVKTTQNMIMLWDFKCN